MAVPQQTPEAGPSTVPSLTPALVRRLHPKAYLSTFVQEGIRPDGRPLVTPESKGSQASEAQWRDVSVNLGSVSTAPASALVRMGKTTVVCGITLETAPPDIATPYDGYIVPNVDLPPLCSPIFRPGAPSDEAQVLSSRLRDIILSSNLLPLSSLIIEAAKAAFVVYLDIVCLNYDGGVLDAALLACVGALRQLRLPEAVWDQDTSSTVCHPLSKDHPGRELSLGPLPLAVSFSFFETHVLPDPTQFETQLCSSQLTIALAGSRVHAVYQAGSVEGAGRERMKACLQVAQSRAHYLQSLLRNL